MEFYEKLGLIPKELHSVCYEVCVLKNGWRGKEPKKAEGQTCKQYKIERAKYWDGYDEWRTKQLGAHGIKFSQSCNIFYMRGNPPKAVIDSYNKRLAETRKQVHSAKR